MENLLELRLPGRRKRHSPQSLSIRGCVQECIKTCFLETRGAALPAPLLLLRGSRAAGQVTRHFRLRAAGESFQGSLLARFALFIERRSFPDLYDAFCFRFLLRNNYIIIVIDCGVEEKLERFCEENYLPHILNRMTAPLKN
jgi:hypothetical protein